MKTATVVIPQGWATRWLQICVSALKAHRNEADFDILVIDNSPGHDSIKGLTETRLGNGVGVITPPDPNLAGHQIALDMAIDMVKTPWFVAFETDVQILRDGWLDWMLSFVKDDYVALVGWLWGLPGVDDSRHYISPAGALYRTRILKLLKEECLRNNDLACCYGWNMDKRIDFMKEYPHTAGKLIPMGQWGPFSESRGFGNVYPYAKDRDVWCPEPGNWIYNRLKMQWECVHLPGKMLENDANIPGIPHKYTYVGPSDEDAYFRHYWGGSVSHNFEKHKIPQHDAAKLPFWLGREERLWNEVVPQDVREISLARGWVRPIADEFIHALSQVKK